MAKVNVYYKRTGEWPAFTPDAFVVDLEAPADHRVEVHGLFDALPGPRGSWRVITLPELENTGRDALARALNLNGGMTGDNRTGILVADAIACYRAVCRGLSWTDAFDPMPWLQALPDRAVLQRAAIAKVCGLLPGVTEANAQEARA